MGIIYQKIDGDKYRHIFVVGDLHGCYNRLMNQLQELNFDEQQDLLISVGDLIDRGPQNIECLSLIGKPWFAAVQGNHERMAIDAVTGNDDGRLWFANGGQWYWQATADEALFARDLLAEAAKLPFVIELNVGGKKIIVCHADYPAKEYSFMGSIDLQDAVWSRHRVEWLTDNPGGGEPIKGAEEFYFGHTPMRQKWSPLNLNYIDTGAVFGGLLTIVKLK